MITNNGTQLKIEFSSVERHDFHALWLRENSPHPENIDPLTRHKLHDSAFLPLDIKILDASVSGDHLSLIFSDEHTCQFSISALRIITKDDFARDLAGDVTPWVAGSDDLPWHDLELLEKGGQGVLNFLKDVTRFGFALVRGVPVEPYGMRRVTDLIGFLRLTDRHDGGIADVKSVPVAYDLSMSTRQLEPHVDNPYRYPQPGFTLLHCLRNDADGGESILVDGFRVAKIIQDQDPELFKALVEVPVVYRYQDDNSILEYTAPFIDVWPNNAIKQTRFHGRCDQVTPTTPSILDTFYKARRRYADLIWSKDIQLVLKLNPGEMYFADNYRMFHGRASFELESGVRHMRQAYMDRDVVSSRQKTLMRDISAQPWSATIGIALIDEQ